MHAEENAQKPLSSTPKAENSSDIDRPKAAKKLSYKDQRDWEQIESMIAKAEASLDLANQKVSDPSIASSSIKLQEACLEAEKIQAEVDRLYARWSELETLVNSFGK